MGLAVMALACWVVIPALAQAKVSERRRACLNNLGAIARGFSAYLAANEDRWPRAAKLKSTQDSAGKGWPLLPVVLGPFVKEDGAFECPSDVRNLADDSPLRREHSSTTTWFATEGSSYEWWWGDLRGGHARGREPLTRAAGLGQGPADQWLLTDFEPFHAGDDGGAINILHADLKARTSRPKRPPLE